MDRPRSFGFFHFHWSAESFIRECLPRGPIPSSCIMLALGTWHLALGTWHLALTFSRLAKTAISDLRPVVTAPCQIPTAGCFVSLLALETSGSLQSMGLARTSNSARVAQPCTIHMENVRALCISTRIIMERLIRTEAHLRTFLALSPHPVVAACNHDRPCLYKVGIIN